MRETTDDIIQLQVLLDTTYRSAGRHLRSIVTPERPLDAQQLVEALAGVCVLNLATVTARGEPRVAPVDGLFYRGQFWFGSSPELVRFGHIRRRPAVSGSHVRGETMAVIVHGRARIVDLDASHLFAFSFVDSAAVV